MFDTFAKAAFALTPEEPMAGEPILSEDAVYVIALKKRIPSEVQPLDAVRDQLFHDILHDRLARDREHFLGLRLGGGQQPRAVTGYGNNGAPNHPLNIAASAV